MKQGNLLLLGLGLLLPNRPDLWAQPVPHHFSGITVLPDRTVALSLDGSVSNMFTLPAAVSNQFRQMFDLYGLEASTNLEEWTRLDWLLRTNSNANPLLFRDTNAAGFDHRKGGVSEVVIVAKNLVLMAPPGARLFAAAARPNGPGFP